MDNNTVLEMKNIHKSFPGVRALKGVDFHLNKGEIHALMGENGAGKSTLIKVLTGVYSKDEGQIFIDGNDKAVSIHSPQEAQKLGISTVYQEITLCPNLSVAENMYIGRSNKIYQNWKKMNEDADKILQNLDIPAEASQQLASCSIAVQQMVAIARAVDMDCKVLILDEPTAGLDPKGRDEILDQIAYLHKKGNGINGDYNRQWGMGIWSDIRIYGQGNNGWREMSEVFSTACHELGHAAHYTNNRNTYGKCKTSLLESWARCVQYVLTNQEYKELGVFHKLPAYPENGSYNFQAWNPQVYDRNYTPLFIDLIDDFNQRAYHQGNTIYPDDEIHDMPVSVVQDIVFRSKTFADVKRLLLDYAAKNKYAAQLYNLTPETINRLFAVYEN